MNKNSNTYQILYAAVMVVLVGAVLAFIYMALKPQQDENIANDKRRQILSSLHIASPADSEVKATFEKYIVQDMLVDTLGNVVSTEDKVAFNVEMKKNVKMAAAERLMPVFKAVKDGETKYVIPVYGAGLWGPIWGYVAMNADGKTIYGANFSHESETPGLGARITEDAFQGEFVDKSFYPEGDDFKSVEVVKRGGKSLTGAETIDAISGATITSRGVGAMIEACMKPYDAFLKKLQEQAVGAEVPEAPEDAEAPEMSNPD